MRVTGVCFWIFRSNEGSWVIEKITSSRGHFNRILGARGVENGGPRLFSSFFILTYCLAFKAFHRGPTPFATAMASVMAKICCSSCKKTIVQGRGYPDYNIFNEFFLSKRIIFGPFKSEFRKNHRNKSKKTQRVTFPAPAQTKKCN